MVTTTLLTAALLGAASIPTVTAWGAAGHEIVATIAQIHLHPTAHDHICSILPSYANCHLAPIAAWADKVRMHMRWSSTLHYVNGVNDHPSDHCVFGEDGWQGAPGANVLSAIRNTTTWLDEGKEGAEEALKFLVHFVGDMHQPLHLTGRDKGGNGAKVKFDRRITNLHSVWDSRLLAKALRTIPKNYTKPLPSERIEGALRGTIYDPFIRKIMHEGVLDRFNDDIDDWLACPSSDSDSSSLTVQSSRPYPPPAEKAQQLPLVPSSDSFRGLDRADGLKSPPAGLPPTDDNIICPYAWAAPLHQLNCDLIWPPAIDLYSVLVAEDEEELLSNAYLELDTPEYAGRVQKEFVLERLLAMGGIRLAAILNYLFAEESSVINRFLD